jgi:hypothetical protein
MRIGRLVNEDHFVTTLPFRNYLHLPTTQCACADFGDFAKQRNGSGGREKRSMPLSYTQNSKKLSRKNYTITEQNPGELKQLSSQY